MLLDGVEMIEIYKGMFFWVAMMALNCAICTAGSLFDHNDKMLLISLIGLALSVAGLIWIKFKVLRLEND